MGAYKAVAPLENYASPNPDNYCRYHMWEGSNFLDISVTGHTGISRGAVRILCFAESK